MQIELKARVGMTRHYSNGNARVVIGACLNRDVYELPGYYIHFTPGYEKLSRKRFSSGKRAAMAAFKAGITHYKESRS